MFRIILITILLLPSISFAKGYGDVTVDKVISVYDGDTIRVNIKYYPPIIGENMGIRIAGIDTPEMRDKRPKIKKLAKQAKQFALIRLQNGNKIILKNMKRGKYFRIVAEVWVDGKNLGDELIKAGLAKRYGGGKKAKW
jgi:endonuclease YncB( thermonuclease family)